MCQNNIHCIPFKNKIHFKPEEAYFSEIYIQNTVNRGICMNSDRIFSLSLGSIAKGVMDEIFQNRFKNIILIKEYKIHSLWINLIQTNCFSWLI